MAAVRNVTDDRRVIGAMARRFAAVSWTALALLVITGLIQAADHGWTGVLLVKVALVTASAVLTVWHSIGARTQLPAIRGLIQGIILILALVILALAVAL